MILCENKGCNNCKSCLEFESDNHPDFYVIDEGDQTIKIEKIRQMQGKILEKPIISNRKVYIIRNAENMTKEAQNCLLKTLEEPPEFVVIILVASNENSFLNTILSRCTKIKFKNLSQTELKQVLSDNGYSTENEYLLKASGGSVQNAIVLLDKKDLFNEVQKIFSNIDNYTILDVLNKLDILYKNKDDINEILDYIEYIFFEKSINDSKYLNYIMKIEETKKNIKNYSNYDMQIDNLLFTIWEEI